MLNEEKKYTYKKVIFWPSVDKRLVERCATNLSRHLIPNINSVRKMLFKIFSGKRKKKPKTNKNTWLEAELHTRSLFCSVAFPLAFTPQHLESIGQY